MHHPNLEYIKQFVNHTNPKEEYKLITEIGSGTYGDVYKAIHIKSSNYVAIKIMKIDLKDDVTAICQEIHTLKECTHENIVQFFGSYLVSTKLWICMEFCGGQSMQDIYLNLRSPIDEDTIAFISRETLRGLEYMHRLNRIHRDIKGANILLTMKGSVKIADFGIAAKITNTVAKRTTLIGTPYWMAPEVAAVNTRVGIGYDERCDIWAVGITAIEYAELQPPMFDLHPMKALQILGQRSYTPPKLQKRDAWSIKFHSFLKHALLKNERKRPTATELLAHEFVRQDFLNEGLTRDLIALNRKDKDLPVYKSPDKALKSKPAVSNESPTNIINSAHPVVNPKSEANESGVDAQPVLLENLLRPTTFDNFTSEEDLAVTLDRELRNRGHQPLFPTENNRDSLYDNYASNENPNDVTSTENLSKKLDDQRIVSSMSDLKTVSSNGSDGDSLYPVTSVQQFKIQQTGPARPKSITNPLDTGNRPARPDKPPQYLSQLTDNQPKESNNQLPAYHDLDKSSIPPIPRVHMGACFVLMFEGCPLKINSSAQWINPSTLDKLIILGTNDGIYYLNTNEMHESSLQIVARRCCLWLSIIRDTMLTLSGSGPHLYSHNLVSLIRSKQSQEQTMGRITNKFLPKRFQPSVKLADTKGCQMVSIIRNPFTGNKYMCAAIGKNIFLYEWFSPRSSFLEIKRVDVSAVIPCPLLNFDLLVSREQNLPIVCLGIARSNQTPEKYKLNLVNMEENNRSVWFKSSDEQEQTMDLVKVLQIEPNTLLACFPDEAVFLNMSGKIKSSRNRMKSLKFGTYINSVVGLRDSILAFHTHGLKGIDFSGQTTQDISDDKHIYRLLSSDTYTATVLVESKPSENPMDNGNIYMLVGHQDQS